MHQVLKSATFTKWFNGLEDEPAKRRIAAKIKMLEIGYEGDAKYVGGGVAELRIHCGPGYRVYYKRADHAIYLLLCGGTKRSQKGDIARAIKMAGEVG